MDRKQQGYRSVGNGSGKTDGKKKHTAKANGYSEGSKIDEPTLIHRNHKPLEELEETEHSSSTEGASTDSTEWEEKQQEKEVHGEQNDEDLTPKKRKRRRTNSGKRNAIRPHRTPSKNPFIARPSPLDHSQKDSSLNSSEFRGFFNLFIMAGFFFVCSTNVRQLLLQGTLVGLNSLQDLVPLELIPVWFVLVATSFLVVFIQKLKLLHSPYAPPWLTWTLYALLQSVIVIGTIWLLMVRIYPIIPTGVYLGEMIVIAMKMHSYMMTNREFEIARAKKLRKNRNKPKEKEEDDKDPAKYPNNVTIGNFLYFLCAPTLVYELSYPRTEKIRPGYIIEKCITVVGVFSVLHIIVNKYITPILIMTSHITVFEAIINLIMPFMFCYVLVFFIIFDIICNGFAEVARFSDRQFYTDWWNSTTWDEFARKWNKPVHEWLLRHVYLESLKSFKGDRFSATLATFLCSSIAHELVLSVMFRMFRPWMFVLQMTQVPLIFLGRFLKGTRAGNFFFWFGMVVGPPLLAILYCREYVMLLSPQALKDLESQVMENVLPDLLI